jgi:hypothetical protein
LVPASYTTHQSGAYVIHNTPEPGAYTRNRFLHTRCNTLPFTRSYTKVVHMPTLHKDTKVVHIIILDSQTKKQHTKMVPIHLHNTKVTKMVPIHLTLHSHPIHLHYTVTKIVPIHLHYTVTKMVPIHLHYTVTKMVLTLHQRSPRWWTAYTTSN